MPTGSGREVVSALEREGWAVLRQTGSHVIMGKGGQRIPVPVHGNRDLKTGTFGKIARLAGLTPRESKKACYDRCGHA